MWFLKVIQADLKGYLQSLNAPPETIQWILQQPDETRQHYVNEFRKNPILQLQQLQEMQLPQKKSPYTSKEIQRTEDFQEPFRTWALVQLRKHRVRPHPEAPTEDFEYNPQIMNMDRQFSLMYDWWRYSQPQPDIASYTYEQANDVQQRWHDAQAAKGEGLVYEDTHPDSIVFKPDHWNGWSIQQVSGENDLAVEGNLMDHCVGSYCRDVEYGRTRIYSLRDEYNQPHVTIEIDRDWDVRQIQGKSNSEPKDKYKQMIAEWFQELKKENPGLRLYFEEAYEFDFSNVYNSDIDEAIYKEVSDPNEYGLQAPLDELDIETCYENVMQELRRGRQQDVRYVYHIGKAIAWAAWQADKWRAEHTDWKHPDKDITEPDSVKNFMRDTKQRGIQWLWDKIQANDEHLFNNWWYEPSINQDQFYQEHMDDYETENELEEAYMEAVQREEDEVMREFRGDNLPYALDVHIADELLRLYKEDPFLPEHFAHKKRVEEQDKAASNWLQKALTISS